MGQRAAMLLLNYFPLLHVLGTLALVSAPWNHRWERVVAGVASIYILPPVLCRIIRLVMPLREGRIPFGSKDFMIWWTLFCLQTLFCRFPFLEELLRVVPGLYSQWLRLWGARIGRFTYWAAGTMILDRPFLDVGDDVMLGAGVRLNPHVIERTKDGRSELILATVKIGAGAMIGGYSLLTSGTEIGAGESPHAVLLCPPFTLWKEGRRVKDKAEKSDSPSLIWPSK